MRLPPGDVCLSNPKLNYTTTLIIDCDTSINTTQILSTNIDIQSCENTISMRSPNACPSFNVYSFWMSLVSNKWIVGTFLIVFGIFFCFLGTKFIEITEFIAGVLASWFLLCFLLFNWLQVSYSTAAFWIIIFVTLVVGIGIGYLFYKIGKCLPAMILGGFAGYALANFLYQLFLKNIQWNPLVIYWITVILLVAGGAVAAYFFTEHLFILSTAFIGAYALIRGIAFMAGNFPDERQIIELISKGETAQVSSVIIINLSF